MVGRLSEFTARGCRTVIIIIIIIIICLVYPG